MTDATLLPATLGTVLRQATADLRSACIEGPGDDARRLLAAALGLTAAQILACPERPLSANEARRFSDFIARRIGREPVSRIVGEREFYGRSFVIGPSTLDPRPDSETLVHAALDLIECEGWKKRALSILDVGTGSGCLLLSLLAELPLAWGAGTDASLAALDIARHNAVRLGMSGRARWIAADMLEPLRGPFDILISNPPYICSKEIAGLEPEVRGYDPRAALDGGTDGLRFFRRVLTRAREVAPQGWTVLEVGHDQAETVVALARAELAGMGRQEIRLYRDVAGRRRCVAARARN